MPGTTITETTQPGKILEFTEDDHKYVVKSKTTGKILKELISVTTLIGEYFPKFDADAIAPRVASRRGVSVEEIKAEWKRAADEASVYGTRVHEYMEDLLKGRKPRNIPQDERERAVFGYGRAFIKRLLPAIDQIECEKTICDVNLGVAGTIDLLCRDVKNQRRMIIDWKTNKKISMQNDFGKHAFPPIDYIDDCEFGHYSLQLNLYEYILKHAGYIPWNERVGKMLVHLHKDSGINIIKIPDHQNDIKLIIQDWEEKNLQ